MEQQLTWVFLSETGRWSGWENESSCVGVSVLYVPLDHWTRLQVQCLTTGSAECGSQFPRVQSLTTTALGTIARLFMGNHKSVVFPWYKSHHTYYMLLWNESVSMSPDKRRKRMRRLRRLTPVILLILLSLQTAGGQSCDPACQST